LFKERFNAPKSSVFIFQLNIISIEKKKAMAVASMLMMLSR
jgi:hypothetical protein